MYIDELDQKVINTIIHIIEQSKSNLLMLSWVYILTLMLKIMIKVQNLKLMII